ncbi:MAG: 23S rRNA (adenine(2503)-C(2))-methyltransferase RlmN [Candidatus Berkelbacteria bacterium]|nr:23S rRNA (adenine(2503)-C(2))-methyltransferase RlmN [Candidatus Berkelbacteria bacterium]
MDFYEYLKNLTSLRQKQLRTAIFVNLVERAEDLTTFSKYERGMIEKETNLVPFTTKSEQVSKDGSTKWALVLVDGCVIETVLLQFRDGRNTVCVSSQVGCASGCVFCATGQIGFKRNLTAWEIVSQVLFVSRKLKAKGGKLTNVVFMGMGEPLFNLQNVLFAIGELNNPDYFNLGRRHITVSTCGPIKPLLQFIESDTGTTLAISLHAADQKLREKLMPIAKVNPLSELMHVLDQFVSKTNKKVTYEYLMLKGENDSIDHAYKLAELLKGRLALVNLISFNEIPGSGFRASSRNQIERFKTVLLENRIPVTLRVSLGEEIAGACGQLAGRQELGSKN